MASPNPKRRRSRTLSKRISLLQNNSPHNVSNHSAHGNSPLLCEENDDAAERRQRQQRKVMELQRKNMPSPLQSKCQPHASTLNGLTNSQIADHYKNCIQLSSENKITAKNAFGLHLIDYMSQMLQERDEGMTNFQMASCTIDASTKIYAHRVDSVFADAYKMVGGLAKTNDKSKRSKNNDGGEQSDTDESHEGQRKKKAIKKSKTIATNIATLNMKKLDQRFEVDPLFKKMTASFADGGVSSLLMASLSSRDDNCELMLDSSSNLHSSSFNMDKCNAHKMANEHIQLLNSIDWTAQICPQFADFTFRNWDVKNHDVYGNDAEDNKDPFKTSGSHAFDMDAVPEPIEDDALDNGFGDTAFPDNDVDDDDNDDGNQDAWSNDAGKSMIQPIRFDNFDALVELLSDKPSDYSYFDTRLLSTWAGPNHWRVKPMSKANADTKEKCAKKKAPPVVIDYDEEINVEKLYKKSKKSIRLESRTLQSWSPHKTTMPEDLHYDMNCLTQLFLKPTIKLRLSKQASEVDDGVGQYNYNNANDRENFCPASQDDYGSDGCDADFDDVLNHSSNQTVMGSSMLPSGDAFSGDNLLQQPYKVAKININYAKTAKKVDVQKLKSKMWKIMTVDCDDSNKENIGHNDTVPDKIEGEMNFSQVYETLQNKLPTTMSENLSVHLTFVCFLHLVNEKCLKLISEENMSDFKILQDT